MGGGKGLEEVQRRAGRCFAWRGGAVPTALLFPRNAVKQNPKSVCHDLKIRAELLLSKLIKSTESFERGF